MSRPPRAASAHRPRQPGALKRAFDLTVATAGLVLLVPLLLTLAVLLLLAQGRPVFIRHQRLGRGGRMFPCLKFRTMRVDAEDVLQRHLASNAEARAEWETSRKLKNDPRVTSIGHVLRRSSVDELPQLLNVVRGEMSLVGPRPIVPEEARHYGPRIADYCRVRPGLTGSWQVGGRSDTSYVRRVQLDADYVAQWSLGLDLVILVKTVPAVVRSKGSY